MKVTGAELVQFYEEWPMGDSWYHEGGEMEVEEEDGKLPLLPHEKYDLNRTLGWLQWCGDARIPEDIIINGVRIKAPDDHRDPPSLTACFKAWRGKNIPFVATGDLDQLQGLADYCNSRGIKFRCAVITR